MGSEVTVTHDGKTYIGRKRGCPGSVFADTRAEALARAGTLKGRHPPKNADEPRGKRRGQPKGSA
jgi:hypothetical protein